MGRRDGYKIFSFILLKFCVGVGYMEGLKKEWKDDHRITKNRLQNQQKVKVPVHNK